MPRLRPAAIFKYFRQTFLPDTWYVVSYVYIWYPIGAPRISLPATEEHYHCSSRIKTLIYTFFSARILLHSNSVFLSGPKKPRWTAWHLPDTCPKPSFHSTDVHPDNRPQDGGISPGNEAANCFSSALYPSLCSEEDTEAQEPESGPLELMGREIDLTLIRCDRQKGRSVLQQGGGYRRSVKGLFFVCAARSRFRCAVTHTWHINIFS